MELAAILATCIMSASILISPVITYLCTVNVNIPMVFMEIKQSPTSNLFYGYIVKTDVIHGGEGGMVFITTFNNISVISGGSQFYWWRK